jgi:DNA-binding winged helix-turn-helix (wHTH) protein
MRRSMTNEQKILTMLVGNGLVLRDTLLDAIYGDREDGGPMTADKCLDVYMLNLRQVLDAEGEGWEIETIRGYVHGCDTKMKTQTAVASPPISIATAEGLSASPKLTELLQRGAFALALYRIKQRLWQSTSCGAKDSSSEAQQRIAS